MNLNQGNFYSFVCSSPCRRSVRWTFHSEHTIGRPILVIAKVFHCIFFFLLFHIGMKVARHFDSIVCVRVCNTFTQRDVSVNSREFELQIAITRCSMLNQVEINVAFYELQNIFIYSSIRVRFVFHNFFFSLSVHAYVSIAFHSQCNKVLINFGMWNSKLWPTEIAWPILNCW